MIHEKFVIIGAVFDKQPLSSLYLTTLNPFLNLSFYLHWSYTEMMICPCLPKALSLHAQFTLEAPFVDSRQISSVVAVPVFVVAYLKRHETGWFTSIASAVILSVLIYVIFDFSLQVHLTRGLIVDKIVALVES